MIDHNLTKDQYAMILNVLENFKPIIVDLRFDDYKRQDYLPIKVNNIYGKIYPSYTHYCINENGKEKNDHQDQYDTIYDIRVNKDTYTNVMTIALLLGCSKCLNLDVSYSNCHLESYRSKWIKHERSITGNLDFHNFLLINFQWIYDHMVKELDKSKAELFNHLYNYDRVNFKTGEIYTDHELKDRLKI